LSESEFAQDPVHPRLQSDLIADLKKQTTGSVMLLPLSTVREGVQAIARAAADAKSADVRYLLCDCENQQDLADLAQAFKQEEVPLGSSVLAEELAQVWPLPPRFDPLAGAKLEAGSGTLVIAGSVMPQSRAQIDALARAGASVFTIESSAVIQDRFSDRDLRAQVASELASGKTVVVRSDNCPDAVEATKRLASQRRMSERFANVLVGKALAAFAELAVGRLIVLGGETSAAVCRRLRIDEMIVLDEIEPGLPCTMATGANPLLLVLKSGSFGTDDFLLKAINYLGAKVAERAHV
jgi:uncharacterized protein YgbK (DUF1537 family)